MADRTRTRILTALKSSGPQTAAGLAADLGITTVAVRQHLDSLLGDVLVGYQDSKGGVGRPKRVWSLTDAGHLEFPDNHSGLVQGLMSGVGELFGEEGVDRLIAHREAQSARAYGAAMKGVSNLSEKVAVLASIRNQEGYMAEVVEQDKGFLLIENHCSIGAAANTCPGFCRSELSLFRSVLGNDVTVERTEHRLSGDRRCVYKIAPRP